MSYKNSKIYQHGYELTLLVETVCRAFPRHEQYALGQQLRNASRSIVANYVEGYVRQKGSRADHRRFLTYCQGSCDETKFWLELGKDIGYLDEQVYVDLIRRYEELGKMLYSVLYS
jgi:four helix bundle protein